jgi:hypothetical protein
LCPLYVGVFIGSREEAPPQGQSFSTVHPKKNTWIHIWKYFRLLAAILKGGFILILAISYVINDPYTFQSSLIIAPYI